MAVGFSDICNTVSIFKFDLQLSHCNERESGRDKTGSVSQSIENMNPAGIIFMDIYKEMSPEKRYNKTKCSKFAVFPAFFFF